MGWGGSVPFSGERYRISVQTLGDAALLQMGTFHSFHFGKFQKAATTAEMWVFNVCYMRNQINKEQPLTPPPETLCIWQRADE